MRVGDRVTILNISGHLYAIPPCQDDRLNLLPTGTTIEIPSCTLKLDVTNLSVAVNTALIQFPINRMYTIDNDGDHLHLVFESQSLLELLEV